MNPLILLAVLATAIVVGVIVVGSSSADTSQKHAVGNQGWVTVDPRVLSASVGVSDNTYALASMMQSESGDNPLLQAATGWAARNMADSRGISVFHLLTHAGHYDKSAKQFIPHESNGFYGPQNVGPRYATTRHAPSAAALDLAAQILTGEIDDPTGGCTQFDAPSAQDSLLGKVAGYLSSAADVASSRSKNADLVMLPGISSTRFWRPKNG